MEHNSLEVWFRSFSFPNGGIVGSMLLIFQGFCPAILTRSGFARFLYPFSGYQTIPLARGRPDFDGFIIPLGCVIP